jgi:hypothetical protein
MPQQVLPILKRHTSGPEPRPECVFEIMDTNLPEGVIDSLDPHLPVVNGHLPAIQRNLTSPRAILIRLVRMQFRRHFNVRLTSRLFYCTVNRHNKFP